MNMKRIISKKALLYSLSFIFSSFILWVIQIAISNNISYVNLNSTMFVFEWSTVIILLFAVISWKKFTGNYFTPYTIFFFFLTIFCAGQFIMWAFGIHYITDKARELGVATHVRYMDYETILKIMMINVVALTAFHGGALLFGIRKPYTINTKSDIVSNEKMRIALKYVGMITLAVSSAVTFYDCIKNINVANLSGYSSLYYGDNGDYNILFKYLGYLFLPSIIAVFVGNKCSKRSFFWLSSLVVAPFVILNAIIGDRDNWLYFVILWFWCYLHIDDRDLLDIKIYKKKKRRKVIFCVILGGIGLCLLSVFVEFREIGFTNITADDFIKVFSDLSYVFIKPFFEMGQTARVLGIIIQDGLTQIWNGGNTYIAGIVSMPIPRIKLFLGFQDGYLDNWFSQTYLGLENYGAGFTAVAEAYLNGGELFYPFYMFILGGFIGKISNIQVRTFKNINYGKLFFVLSSITCLLAVTRGSVELSLRKWFYGCVIVWCVSKFVSLYFTLVSNRIKNKK